MSAIEAVVFDLDGVLVDSEHVWDEVREGLARERGGRWHERATVSSEEVPHGKPTPDVFLDTARRLVVPPEACAAVEDSANGIRAAHAAGMRVIAIPNRRYPPPPDALALAEVVLGSLAELTPSLVARNPRG